MSLCKAIRIAILSFLVLAGIISQSTSAMSEGVYRLGTGVPTGNYHPVGIAISTLLQLKKSEQNSVLATPISSSGAIANMHALLKGDIDIAFVDATTVVAALIKSPPFNQYPNSHKINALAVLWPDVAHLIVRESQRQTGKIEDFQNLIGETVSLGPRKSTTDIASHHLFSSIGIYYDKLFTVPNLDHQQSVDAFENDVISGLSLFTADGDLRIGGLLSNPDAEAALLSVDETQISKMNKSDIAVWRQHVIEANTYANQPYDVKSVAQANFLVVRSDFDMDDAHHLTRTIFDNLTFIEVMHPAAKRIEKANEQNKLILALHPGSAKYFRDANKCAGLLCVFN